VIFPLKDDIPSRSWPFVTVTLVVLNVVAFLYQFSLGIDVRGPGAGAAQAFVAEFGVIPCRLTAACPGTFLRLADDFPHPWATIFTSMFLHANLIHIGGNMLFLWIFGRNVEDTVGHGRFVLFYLASGVVAVVGQTLVTPTSSVPMIGASGAISGVLGAYLLLFPHATILTLVMFGFFIKFVRIPALIVLGFWIVLWLLNGYLTYSAQTYSAQHLRRGESGGVAWFAHIGGFLGGIALLFLLRPRQSSRL
jgi:membrane associated rhomboid family serine protease